MSDELRKVREKLKLVETHPELIEWVVKDLEDIKEEYLMGTNIVTLLRGLKGQYRDYLKEHEKPDVFQGELDFTPKKGGY